MARKKHPTLPSYDELIQPVFQALTELGGSGHIEEINEKVYGICRLSEDSLKIPHDDSSSRTEVEYRLAWARTYLKKAGLIENSSRSVWSISNSKIKASQVKGEEIVRKVREDTIRQREKEEVTPQSDKLESYSDEEEVAGWREQLINVLYGINASAFERLTQRLLRESGFSQVEVTGKSGDGGIDGKGIVRINGFLSFHVIFQCKRYKGSITPSQIRDFRGAMQGRADKGIFITTGTFTRESIKEATRDGAPPIDLIDGELLCEKLKEMKLGVETKFVEAVDIKREWFQNL